MLVLVFIPTSTVITVTAIVSYLQFKKNEVQSADDAPYNYAIFHFIFSMGSMYFAMLFINWQLNQPTKK